jgi:hypothetical protein
MRLDLCAGQSRSKDEVAVLEGKLHAFAVSDGKR